MGPCFVLMPMGRPKLRKRSTLRDRLVEKSCVVEVTKFVEWRRTTVGKQAEGDDKKYQYTELHDWHPVFPDNDAGTACQKVKEGQQDGSRGLLYIVICDLSLQRTRALEEITK